MESGFKVSSVGASELRPHRCASSEHPAWLSRRLA
jgi:hypothetical protein